LSEASRDFVRKNTAPGYAPLVPEIALHLAGAVTPLWQATEETLARDGLPPPFWAFAWPGGQSLARLLLDQPALARGRTVLDFAAGCGIAGIAAAKSAAATVTASEIDGFAIAAIGLNALLNDVSIATAEHDVLPGPADRYELILAGDVCYEKPMADRVLSWLRRAAASGADVLIADPGRAYLPAGGLIPLAQYDVPTSLDLENRKVMRTTVYRFDPFGRDAPGGGGLSAS
jgi:predicted nicotinamide N-methyase